MFIPPKYAQEWFLLIPPNMQINAHADRLLDIMRYITYMCKYMQIYGVWVYQIGLLIIYVA